MNEILKKKYCEILISNGIGSQHLGMPIDRPGGSSGLSGLFLPSVCNQYEKAKNRVMIVGLETRRWEPLGNKAAPNTYDPFESIEHYVDRSMRMHDLFLKKKLENNSADRGRSFHNFMREVSRVAGVEREGIIYANLFCFAWGKRKKSPTFAGDFFKKIECLSMDLIWSQIEILKPSCIIFSGYSGEKYRKVFLPNESGHIGYLGVPERFLQGFTLNETIKCFRVDHPSSRYRDRVKCENSSKGRRHVLYLLEQALAQAL